MPLCSKNYSCPSKHLSITILKYLRVSVYIREFWCMGTLEGSSVKVGNLAWKTTLGISLYNSNTFGGIKLFGLKTRDIWLKIF